MVLCGGEMLLFAGNNALRWLSELRQLLQIIRGQSMALQKGS